MSILSGFRSFNFDEGVPYVSITTNGVTFNKSVVVKLNYPEYVVLLINEEERMIAVQVCDEHIENSVPFYKEKKSGIVSVRWNGRDLLNTLEGIMPDWNLKQIGYRIDGTHLRAENAILFDLNKAVPLK